MSETITISTKGQVTLPAAIRKKLQLQEGDKLIVDYDEAQRLLTFRKALSIDELSAYLTSKIKPGTKPVLDVDAYYQKYRKPRI